METLGTFLGRLLREGRAIFREPPGTANPGDRGAVEVLERAFEVHRLDVAGPPIAFDARAAVAAGELMRQAAWALVSRQERPEDLAKRLAMPGTPASPAQHLSADLTLRYLPVIHRRAWALDPGDVLVERLEDVMRRWPLSGVLAGLEGGPGEPPDFGGHRGLMMLYAERLARDERAAWAPAGWGREVVELVREEAGGRHGG